MWWLSQSDVQTLHLICSSLGIMVIPFFRRLFPSIIRILCSRLFDRQATPEKSATDIPWFPTDPAKAMATKHTIHLVAAIVPMNQNTAIRTWVGVG